MTRVLTLEARERLDHYLAQVRASLRGRKSVDADEVERDIRDHVEAEIAGRQDPVTADEVETVIQRLGAPAQWVGADEVPVWRRMLTRWHEGDAWRLPYLSLAAAALGVVLLGLMPLLGLVLVAVGFILARSTVALVEESGEEMGARRWLVTSSQKIWNRPAADGRTWSRA